MPLMYVPFIMYASWMDFMTRGFVVPHDRINVPSDEEQQAKESRTSA